MKERRDERFSHNEQIDICFRVHPWDRSTISSRSVPADTGTFTDSIRVCREAEFHPRMNK